jgi:hypothetical protein
MNFLDSLGKWIAQITLVALLIIPLAIVLQVLFGSVTPFFHGVVTNLVTVIKAFGDSGLIGLIAIAIVVWLFTHSLGSAKE